MLDLDWLEAWEESGVVNGGKGGERNGEIDRYGLGDVEGGDWNDEVIDGVVRDMIGGNGGGEVVDDMAGVEFIVSEEGGTSLAGTCEALLVSGQSFCSL